jgi:hypothetical protein
LAHSINSHAIQQIQSFSKNLPNYKESIQNYLFSTIQSLHSNVYHKKILIY